MGGGDVGDVGSWWKGGDVGDEEGYHRHAEAAESTATSTAACGVAVAATAGAAPGRHGWGFRVGGARMGV